MRVLAIVLAGLIAAGLPACARDDAEARFQREMRAAETQAREQLPYFWDRFTTPAEDEYDFLVRAEFAHADGPDDVELLWVEVSGRSETAISGFLASDPSLVTDLKKGDPVSLTEEDIVDWAFFQGETLLGHYTTRVSLPRMDVDQAEALRSILGDNPE